MHESIFVLRERTYPAPHWYSPSTKVVRAKPISPRGPGLANFMNSGLATWDTVAMCRWWWAEEGTSSLWYSPLATPSLVRATGAAACDPSVAMLHDLIPQTRKRCCRNASVLGVEVFGTQKRERRMPREQILRGDIAFITSVSGQKRHVIVSSSPMASAHGATKLACIIVWQQPQVDWPVQSGVKRTKTLLAHCS